MESQLLAEDTGKSSVSSSSGLFSVFVFLFFDNQRRNIHVLNAEMLDIKLMECELVHEGLHKVIRGEVENEPKGDGDGKGRQRFLENGEQE